MNCENTINAIVSLCRGNAPNCALGSSCSIAATMIPTASHAPCNRTRLVNHRGTDRKPGENPRADVILLKKNDARQMTVINTTSEFPSIRRNITTNGAKVVPKK